MQDITSLVSIINGKTTTTSIKVAEFFGKDHFHVVRDIEKLQVPDGFRKSNFEASEYGVKNSIGKTVKYPMYNITRDGFTLLAMGFTGAKAMQFKIAYIEAFNRMEEAFMEARRGMMTVEDVRKAMEPVIRENERLKAQCDLSRHFLPSGAPGDLNRHGIPKTKYRRGYYTSGNGKSIVALIERYNQPGLFDEMELKQIGNQEQEK